MAADAKETTPIELSWRLLERATTAGLNGPQMLQIVAADIAGVAHAQFTYKDSWKKRGGVGAFFTFARKWDRLENGLQAYGYDVFRAISEDRRAEGVIDDIRDLRRYLLHVEAEMMALGVVIPEVQKGEDGK